MTALTGDFSAISQNYLQTYMSITLYRNCAISSLLPFDKSSRPLYPIGLSACLHSSHRSVGSSNHPSSSDTRNFIHRCQGVINQLLQVIPTPLCNGVVIIHRRQSRHCCPDTFSGLPQGVKEFLVMPPVDQAKRNELGFEGIPSYDSQHLSMSFDSAKWQSLNQGIDWRRESLQVQGYPMTTKDRSWASTPNSKVGSRWT